MAVITAVERRGHAWQVLLDSGERIPVSGALLRLRPLEAGQTLDTEEYDRWLLLHQYRQALDRAVRLLAMRSHSSGELSQKLLRAGYRPCTVEMVLCKLNTLHLLDDAAFAGAWAASRSRSGYGGARILRELRAKGISPVEAEAAVSGLAQEEQAESARTLAQRVMRRAKPGEDPRKTAQRAMAALIRKGFSWEEARAALACAVEEES